jgi:protein TonB
VKPAGGGTPRLAPLLLASLLLHLAAIAAVIFIVDREMAVRRATSQLNVDYIEPPGSRKSLPEKAQHLPAPVNAPEPRRVVLPKPLPAAPPMAMPSRKERGEGAPPASGQVTPKHGPPGGGGSPALGIAPIAPTAPGGADMVFPVGSGSGRGGGTGSGAGEGAGTGTGAGRYGNGTGGTHGGNATSASSGALQRRAAYQALLKRLIEAHKEYPLAARRSRLEGNCVRRFTISRGGTLKKVESLSSCGHEYLDDAATRAITAVGTFPPLPDEITGTEATFEVPIRFMLRNE